MTQKEKIIEYLKQTDGWVQGYKLCSVRVLDDQWIGSQGDRRARELAEAGILERRINGKYAEYRYKKPVQLHLYEKSIWLRK